MGVSATYLGTADCSLRLQLRPHGDSASATSGCLWPRNSAATRSTIASPLLHTTTAPMCSLTPSHCSIPRRRNRRNSLPNWKFACPTPRHRSTFTFRTTSSARLSVELEVSRLISPAKLDRRRPTCTHANTAEPLLGSSCGGAQAKTSDDPDCSCLEPTCSIDR